MRFISIDQSLSNCAIVVFEDEKVIWKEVVRTGSTASSGKRKKDVVYFNTMTEQIAHICNRILSLVEDFEAEHVVLESLSLSSIGNQTRNLAGLFHCIHYVLFYNNFPLDSVHTIAPTSVKSFARDFLDQEDQVEKNSKGKLVKVKMQKSHMVKAVEAIDKSLLEGYSMSSGKADIADSFLIGMKWRKDYERTT